MVYRKKSGHVGFNNYDIAEFMTRHFNIANNIEELHLIKETFDIVMDEIISRISCTMNEALISEIQPQQYTKYMD